ncbi:MAG TPA: hypothetical protein VN258_06215 [Mobilitalea sp.]|nr:hypothetical protein [Mobilitalea sp.]
MKILFWSPVHGQTATTSNILATSMVAGMYYRKKVVLTQTQFSFNNLEAPIVGANAYNAASKEFFREIGIDTLIRCFKAAKLDKETLENCCIALENTNILLLPGTSKTIKESFEYEMEAVIVNLLKAMEAIYGVIFVDICSGENSLSMKLLEEADLVVINLSQNLSVLDLFFQQYKDKLSSNVFYLFGKYDCNSKYNINNIRRKYRKMITQKNSGVIPYHTGYMDAQTDGKVVEFFRDNLNCSKKDEAYYFMLKVKNATEKILKQAGIYIEGK